nr:outer membrane beta-barrel protein [Bradyrhizobium sp. 170]
MSSKVDWLSLNSVRVGFVAADRLLVYGKGGVALARESHHFGFEQALGVGSVAFDFKGRALHTGLLAGVGAEYAFLGNWSAKLEYNYLNFGPQDVMTTGVQTLNIPPATIGSKPAAGQQYSRGNAPGEVRHQLSLQRNSCRDQRPVLTLASGTKAQARTLQLGQGKTWQQV